jgi:endonuclease/exonuclease/phosphatase family metal-dependent hydrolase
MSLALVTYNIRFGGRGRRREISQLLGHLDPDVVILQEATDPTFVQALGADIGLPHVVAEAGRSLAALSRLPIAGATLHPRRPGRGVLELRLDEPELRIFGVHLTAGLSRRGERRRLVEMERLLELARPSADDVPTALVGDFNAVAPGDERHLRRMPLWIQLLLRFDGGIRTEVMAAAHEAGFRDAFRTLDPGGAGLTMPSWAPSVRLDYILLGPEPLEGLRACSVVVDPLVAQASDHLPLMARLDLPPRRRAAAGRSPSAGASDTVSAAIRR